MYNSYSQQGYGSFGAGGMYNSSMYGSGGYYNNPFNSATSYGLGNSNTFLRSAEESSRGAFQSIESVVHAFSAVSAMFESTYYAVYNSFRAVVGVADQFYRLKTHLSGILSAFALVRMLRFMYRRCLYLLGIRKEDGSSDQVWSNVAKKLSDAEMFVKENRKKQTNWPLIMFLAVVLGGPWLIWRVLSSIESLNKDDSLWMTGKIDHFIAVSEYDFDAVNADELSFRRGQRIIIAPKGELPKIKQIIHHFKHTNEYL
jgi:peroxin-13